MDRTNKHQNKLINIPRTIKAEGGKRDITYKRLYQKDADLQSSVGCPESTKRTHPLDP